MVKRFLLQEMIVTNLIYVRLSYIVFKINDIDKLLPEYLSLLFERSEFNRYARFHSWEALEKRLTGIQCVTLEFQFLILMCR